MGAPGVDRKVISGLCCVDRMKASVVRPDGVGDGALGDPRDKRRGPCYSALGALQEVVISHDIFSADHHGGFAIACWSACQRRSPLDRTALEIGYRELPQVCKYDAPRRRRLGRVTTERRISVGAEREPREREKAGGIAVGWVPPLRLRLTS